MASWQSYVGNLKCNGCCQEATIVGYCNDKYVWAAMATGVFQSINYTNRNRYDYRKRPGSFLYQWFDSWYKVKCLVIRDSLYVDGDCTMDIQTKNQCREPTYNVAVGRAGTALVIVMGKKGDHRGTFNKKAYETALYLRR